MFQEFRNLLALQCCKWHIAVLENFPADKYAMPTTYHACSNEVTFRSDWEIRCCCLFKRSNLHRRNPRPTSSACPPSSPFPQAIMQYFDFICCFTVQCSNACAITRSRIAHLQFNFMSQVIFQLHVSFALQ